MGGTNKTDKTLCTMEDKGELICFQTKVRVKLVSKETGEKKNSGKNKNILKKPPKSIICMWKSGNKVKQYMGRTNEKTMKKSP